ncbi:MAG: type II secretion system protein GspD [Chlamydiales bacterium]
MRIFILFISSLLVSSSPLLSQTIAEKKASLTKGSGDIDRNTEKLVAEFNQRIFEQKAILRALYRQAQSLIRQQDYAALEVVREEIGESRQELIALEKEWQSIASEFADSDPYALWHQPETSLEELVIDYGAQDFVYLIPPDVGSIKVSINSSIPIPRAAWSGMLESILTQNGVGIRQLTPFLRELYLLKDRQTVVRQITNSESELAVLPPDERIAFILTPNPQDVRRITFFLEKFANPLTTFVQQVGRDILLVAQVKELQDLLHMYEFIAASKANKEYKLIPLLRVKSGEMAKILQAMFDQLIEFGDKGSKGTKSDAIDTNGLKVVIVDNLNQGLFLVGTPEEIAKAERLIKEIENQFAGARQKTIFWYTCKHSTAEDLAVILQQVYTAMMRERIGIPEQQQRPGIDDVTVTQTDIEVNPPNRTVQEIGRDSFYLEGEVAINPAPVTLFPPKPENGKTKPTENFIVDPKTGSIIMVVEQDLLFKLKEVIKKLDVPKKMVQIEVLLFEKRFNDRTSMGLNLLRIGSCASQVDSSCLVWNDIIPGAPGAGILEYFLSRARNNGIPAFDLAYRFMISQDDIQINANPSVVTINQVPARIAILDELSINTGINFIETTGTATPRDTFTRAQYGITLEITPTIHMAGEEGYLDDGIDYISLDTSVNFDTFQQASLATDRPIVTRRNVRNEVLIPDGQTVILGGLRRKDTQDIKDKIPYLGEIPGFGKFFSTSTLMDTSVEMFIFITPKIVKDPEEDLYRIRCEQMCRRPGDSPDFICMLNQARCRERNQIFAGTIKMLFGPGCPTYFRTKKGPCCTSMNFSQYETPYERSCCKEYDGRS